MRQAKLFGSMILVFITLSCRSLQTDVMPTAPITSVRPETSTSKAYRGWLVINAQTKDTIVQEQSEQLFIPGSNIKILTLYAALKSMPAKLPTALYQVNGDTIYIQGLGNPTTLHPEWGDRELIELIKPYKQAYLAPSPQNLWPWGPGWAWEDYDTYFAAEKNALPLWGNQLWAIPMGQNTEFYPKSMLKKVRISAEKPAFRRARNANEFFVPQRLQDTLSIPLLTDDGLTAKLLEEASGTPTSIQPFPDGTSQLLYGRNRDQVLKKMMWQSDNFLAEQILLQVNYQRTGHLVDPNGTAELAKAMFPFWKEKIRWVDASGLSRYNLMSPKAIVQALESLYDLAPYESLKSFFPAGGQRGTLKNRFKNPEGKPYVYAKTGSMGQVYCLGGYLETDSGQILVFSAMYNNFTQPTSSIIQEIENKLKTLKSEN